MNKYLKKVTDILDDKEYDRVVVAINDNNRSIMTNMIEDYIKEKHYLHKTWQMDIDNGELESINFLFFRIQENELKMLRQTSPYDENEDEKFFPVGTFFEEIKGIKKKLDL